MRKCDPIKDRKVIHKFINLGLLDKNRKNLINTLCLYYTNSTNCSSKLNILLTKTKDFKHSFEHTFNVKLERKEKINTTGEYILTKGNNIKFVLDNYILETDCTFMTLQLSKIESNDSFPDWEIYKINKGG